MIRFSKTPLAVAALIFIFCVPCLAQPEVEKLTQANAAKAEIVSISKVGLHEEAAR